ncbi:MAG: LysM peptidoglycan-binding domain-containing protein [Tissierellia bacterium]|nr:LysM peptidoglycan-binding domain-containing protein [Tissierellia bacterium]
MKNKRYVVVNSKRFFVFLTIVLVFLAMIISLIFTFSSAHSSIHVPKYKEYYVSHGDNLWNISLEYMPKDYDVRKMIYEIKSLNNLETGEIFHGDILKIPIYD